jgi:hypothetical protein
VSLAGNPLTPTLSPNGERERTVLAARAAFAQWNYFFFLARFFRFGGGLNTMPSSFMPSGSVKYTA